MTKEFIEEPLALPGSAKYLICNFVETQGVFKQVVNNNNIIPLGKYYHVSTTRSTMMPW